MKHLQDTFSDRSGSNVNGTLATDQNILEELNSEEVVRLIPLIVFLVLVCVTGIPGNGLVCYIYRSKYSTSSSRWFIFFLGIVDLIQCALVVPFEIATTLQQYTFTNVVWCKFTSFFSLWILLCLAQTLVIVSVDRYRKVCKPLGWQINFQRGRRLCIMATIVACVVSLPILHVYDIYQIQLPNSNIAATECSFRKSAEESKFAFIYVLFGMVLFSTLLVIICILYCFIGSEIKKVTRNDTFKRHKSLTASLARRKEHIQPIATVSERRLAAQLANMASQQAAQRSAMYASKVDDCQDVAVTYADNAEDSNEITVDKLNTTSEMSNSMESIDELSEMPEHSPEEIDNTDPDSATIVRIDVDSEAHNINRTGKRKNQSGLRRKSTTRVRSKHARKATFSMFLISLAFVLSYIPFLGLLLARSAQDGFDESLTDTQRAAYKFFLRSCFLNCAINPFIYGLSDSHFRRSCKDALASLYERLCCVKRLRLNR